MVVLVKPYERMSLPALLAELMRWDNSLAEVGIWGPLRAQAEGWREQCASEIARRQGSAA